MRELIMSSLEALRGHRRVTIHEARIGQPASAEDIDRAESALCFPMPYTLRSFFSGLDGCHIAWSYKPAGGREVTSYFSMNSVAEMFGGYGRGPDTPWDDDVGEDSLWNSSMEPAVVQELRCHREICSIVGASEWVTLRIDRKASTLDLHFVDRGRVERLPFTVEAYLRSLATSLGYEPIFRALISGQMPPIRPLSALLPA